MVYGTTGIGSSVQTVSNSLSASYTNMKKTMEDPDFGTDPNDMTEFQFQMNEWSTKYSALSNSISSFFGSMKQSTQNLKI